MTHETKYFNAHHSPMGAFATMTLGYKGSKGGIASELKGPADEAIYVGLEEARRPGMYQCFPFFDGAETAMAAEDYDIEGLRDYQFRRAAFPFADGQISRSTGMATDTWSAGDLTMTVFNPVRPIPDPETASDEELRLAIVPAVIVELTVDNRSGTAARKAFLGFSGADKGRTMRTLSSGKVVGVAQGTRTGIACQEEGAYAGTAWQIEAVLEPRFGENLEFALGNSGLVVVSVPAGEVKTLRFAVGFFDQGIATTGIETSYYYTSLFSGLEEVLAYALEHGAELTEGCRKLDERVLAELGPTRALMAGQAMKSYYGSTQFLKQADGRPLWVVNEGEYRMMNTFDLTVDQLYFELAMNPWTVRNVLDLFVERYSYQDEVRFPGEGRTYPGGLAFTHDMGVANHFSDEGRSSYEQAGLKGVFSYMSCEELVNWVLCAGVYVSHTGDIGWLKKSGQVFADCLTSLVNRDNPDPQLRNGVMSLDSSRCQGGAEISTYDSLDKSLGQARNNAYMAVKTWAAYLLLEEHLRTLGEDLMAETARSQAVLCADTICRSVDEDGLLPAVIGEGIDARIIPAIEGLIFPFVAGRSDLVSPAGPFGKLRKVLERHFDLVMERGLCKFPDGAWKLSSTSRNSWLSKIYLCQFIAEHIFNRPVDSVADEAHLAWLMDEDNRYFAWSDQMLSGKAHGSRYYPRGVTSVLWLAKGQSPIAEIREFFIGSGGAKVKV